MTRSWLLMLAACGEVEQEAVAPIPEPPAELPAMVVAEPAPAVPVSIETVASPAPAAAPAPTPAVTPAPAASEPVAVVEAEPEATPASEPVPTAADYALVPRSNGLYVVVTYQRGTVGAALAHDHVVVATRYSGTVHWDPADPSSCRIAVDVPTSGLRVDPPGARAKGGLDGAGWPDDHPKIEENFNSRRQLDSERFPVLTFRSERCSARADGRFDVTGPLTIHGVARHTTVAMTIEVEGDELVARGRFDASHSDFGMTPFSAAMGAVRNAEGLVFGIDLVGRVTP